VAVDNYICVDQNIWVSMPLLPYVLDYNNRLVGSHSGAQDSSIVGRDAVTCE